MTENARIVLQDTKHAISAHSEGSEGEAFRVSWMAVVTLLRAADHVLI